MIYSFNGVKIHYKYYKIDDSPVNVFLHGWDRNLNDFEQVASCIDNKNSLLIDFPPFGLSGEIEDWTIYTYVNMVICLLRHLNIRKCNLIGHSFGGRVAIILAGMEKEIINRVVLVGSAGMRPKRSIKYWLKIFDYKLRKKINLSTQNYGSNDYKKLDENMKKIFNSIVTTYLEDNAKLIEANTLIVFGENDNQTPIYMAKRLHKLIKNSELFVMKNCGHFCFIEREIMFREKLNNFLLEE